jgi:hypothetical protein
MSSVSAPFGLRPSFFPTGLERAQCLQNGITSGYAANILKGQPVAYVNAANVGATGSANGTIIAAQAPGAASASQQYAVAGSFQGVEYTDTTGRRRVSNYWPSGTTVLAGSVTNAYFYNDLNIVYEIQADGSMAQTSIGNEFLFTNIASGSSVTGLSQATLGSATAVGNGNQGQMRVVDLAQGVDNAWGDAFTVVRVQLSSTNFFGQFTATV